jgi:hypothetical protein
MKTQHTLSSVQSDFAIWRQNKISSRERIPETLKRRAVSLLSDNSPSNITNTLSISRTMFKRWQETLSPTSSDEDIDFISLPASDPAMKTPPTMSLTLTFNEDRKLIIEGNLCSDQLSALMCGIVSAMENP